MQQRSLPTLKETVILVLNRILNDKKKERNTLNWLLQDKKRYNEIYECFKYTDEFRVLKYSHMLDYTDYLINLYFLNQNA
jgi:hypothetical protein